MIDLNLRLSPAAVDAAEAGDTDALRRQLDPADLEDVVTDAIVGAVTDPTVRLDVVDADGRGATIRRGYISPIVSLLHANGDDRATVSPVLAAQSGAELVHVLLAGLGLGPRPAPDGDDEVELDDPQDTLRAALGDATLPGGITLPTERSLRWWSIDTDVSEDAPITVLDAHLLWRQSGPQLVPADVLSVWDAFAPLLGRVSRLQRPPHPDQPDADTPTDPTAGDIRS